MIFLVKSKSAKEIQSSGKTKDAIDVIIEYPVRRRTAVTTATLVEVTEDQIIWFYSAFGDDIISFSRVSNVRLPGGHSHDLVDQANKKVMQ